MIVARRSSLVRTRAFGHNARNSANAIALNPATPKSYSQVYKTIVKDDLPTDYAALIRAAQTAVPEPPDWLTEGKHIYSTEHGIGEIMALLGKRLIVRFLEDINPTQFSDWPSAVESGSLQSQ